MPSGPGPLTLALWPRHSGPGLLTQALWPRSSGPSPLAQAYWARPPAFWPRPSSADLMAQVLYPKPTGPVPLVKNNGTKVGGMNGRINIPYILKDTAPLGPLPCSQSTNPFLDASTHLYMRVCPSVGPWVCPSMVRPLRVFFESRKLIRNSIESLEKLRHCSLTAITCKKILKQNFKTKF